LEGGLVKRWRAFLGASRLAFGFSNILDAICKNCNLLHEIRKETGGAIMTRNLTQLLDNMTPQQRAEVEAFAAFIVVRRH